MGRKVDRAKTARGRKESCNSLRSCSGKMARRLTCFCCCISLFFFPDSLECHNSCDGRLAVPLLLTVISNARTGFNTNLINPSLEFVFSDVFRINDMMVLVCWRPGMTSVYIIEFCFTVDL